MQQSRGPATLLKRDCNTFSYAYSKSFKDCFFIEQLQWMLLKEVLVSEKNLKKESYEEIAFVLISLFYVQIQKPASRSTTTRAFVFLARLIVTKYLKQEVDDDFSVCVDEYSP